MNPLDLSAYRLTIIGSIVVVVLAVGIVIIFGGAVAAAPFLTLVATVAIPALLGLARADNVAAVTSKAVELQAEQHSQNSAALAKTDQKIDAIASTLNSKKG